MLALPNRLMPEVSVAGTLRLNVQREEGKHYGVVFENTETQWTEDMHIPVNRKCRGKLDSSTCRLSSLLSSGLRKTVKEY